MIVCESERKTSRWDKRENTCGCRNENTVASPCENKNIWLEDFSYSAVLFKHRAHLPVDYHVDAVNRKQGDWRENNEERGNFLDQRSERIDGGNVARIDDSNEWKKMVWLMWWSCMMVEQMQELSALTMTLLEHESIELHKLVSFISLLHCSVSFTLLIPRFSLLLILSSWTASAGTKWFVCLYVVPCSRIAKHCFTFAWEYPQDIHGSLVCLIISLSLSILDSPSSIPVDAIIHPFLSIIFIFFIFFSLRWDLSLFRVAFVGVCSLFHSRRVVNNQSKAHSGLSHHDCSLFQREVQVIITMIGV